eukprot:356701-Chlamydomonas_euryale.AAC.8
MAQKQQAVPRARSGPVLHQHSPPTCRHGAKGTARPCPPQTFPPNPARMPPWLQGHCQAPSSANIPPPTPAHMPPWLQGHCQAPSSANIPHPHPRPHAAMV